MIESRRTYRRLVDITATIAIGDGAPEPCRIENLSLTGAFVSGRRMTSGDRIRLSFKLPKREEAVERVATVRWSNGSGIGVQFDGLRARQVWALGKFFEQETREQQARS